METHPVVLVIPAWNEAGTIATVIKRALPYGRVVVVDDGSSDGTPLIAEEAGAIVVVHSRNLGYEGAIETGFRKASEMGARHIVTLDADDSHDPSAIPALCAALDEGHSIAIGSRTFCERWSESLFGIWTRTKWGIPDPLSGFKAYDVELLHRFGSFDRDHRVGTDLLVRAACAGLKVAHLRVPHRKRDGQPRFAGAWKANYRILRALALAMRHCGGNHAN